MKDWVPDLQDYQGPLYLAIVDALKSDIDSGVVADGVRLMPQREMAERLNVSIGTVSRAYTEAERRGFVTGEVGRGTFVRVPGLQNGATRFLDGQWNFALNVPPSTGEAALIGHQLRIIGAGQDLAGLMGYLPHQGLPEHRATVARWIEAFGVSVDPDTLIITPGAQHALDISLRLVAPPGSTVLTEAYTFSGMLALSSVSDYRLVGVALDEDGLVPDALDRAFEESGARVLYATPTLQTPTGTVMSAARRAQVAEILRRHDAYLVEDDAYAFLPETPVRPISSWAPERSFYIVSFAKCLAPGLRIGALLPPVALLDRAVSAMRATGWMASPVMSEAVVKLIKSGELGSQIQAKRSAAQDRDRIAREVLAGLVAPSTETAAYHIWLPLPKGQSLSTVLNQAMMRGVTIAPPLAASGYTSTQPGVRLCLGSFRTTESLQNALETVRAIVSTTQTVSYV